MLGGDGSDEILAGYPTLAAHRLIDYYERIVPWSVRASVVPRLLPLLDEKSDVFHLGQACEHYGKARRQLDELATAKPGGRLLHRLEIHHR